MQARLFLVLVWALFISCVNGQPPGNETPEGAAGALAAYFDAVNQKDYRRAFGFWQSPPDSYENYARSFAETERMQLIVQPPARISAAAGSLYAEIPTVVIAAQKGGRSQTLAGCYTMRRANVEAAAESRQGGWQIYRGRLDPAPAEAEIPSLLAGACAGNPPAPEDRQPSRVPGTIGLEGKPLAEAVTVPPTVEAGKDFQVTVATSGSGCTSQGDTSVILGVNTADIFVYDLTTATEPGTVCTMIFKQFTHQATVRLTRRGEAIIRVWGRRTGGSAPLGEPVVIEKRVTVR